MKYDNDGSKTLKLLGNYFYFDERYRPIIYNIFLFIGRSVLIVGRALK